MTNPLLVDHTLLEREGWGAYNVEHIRRSAEQGSVIIGPLLFASVGTLILDGCGIGHIPLLCIQQRGTLPPVLNFDTSGLRYTEPTEQQARTALRRIAYRILCGIIDG